eukprot:6462240-Amphidinium_carterae.1
MQQMQQMMAAGPTPSQDVTEMDGRTKEQVSYPLRAHVSRDFVAIERVPWRHMEAFATGASWTTVSGEGNLCFWHSAALILREVGHPDSGLAPETLKHEVLQYGVEHAGTLAKELGSTAEAVCTSLHNEAQPLALATEKACVAFVHKYGVSLAIVETQHSYGWIFLAPYAPSNVNVHLLWLQNSHYWKGPAKSLSFTHGLQSNLPHQNIWVNLEAGGRVVRPRTQGHQGCQVPTADWMGRAGGRARRLLLLACSNVTGWGTAQMQLEQWIQHARVPDMWCIQETHLPAAREDQAQSWARAHGLKFVHAPATPTSERGSQGGVAICVKNHIGLSRVNLDVPPTLQGRIVAARVNLGPALTVVSAYLTTGLTDEE